MGLIPNFSSSQNLSDNSKITFTDISLGTDSSITTRHMTIQLSDGSYIVPSGTSTSYIDWTYGSTTKLVQVLSKSTAATVTVIWLNGSTPVYTKTINMEWNLYDYVFLFGLLSNQTSQPDIANDINYYINMLKMIVNLINSETAVLKMSDTYSAQSALDKNFLMMQNQSEVF